jgi:hypothetical protein
VHVLADAAFLAPAGFGVFLLFWLVLAALGFGGFITGIVALIDIAQTPTERFGPWWDNTRQIWIIGIAVSFALPLGPLIAGIVRSTGIAGRPFWAGPPKPPPPWGPTPPGWSPGAPPGPPPPGWGPPPQA